jgi:hypothetical protein
MRLAQSRLRVLNQSEDRPSPVTAAKGHPRQHVGRLGKAEEHAEEEGKTKSVFTNTAQQDPGDIHIQTAYPVVG